MKKLFLTATLSILLTQGAFASDPKASMPGLGEGGGGSSATGGAVSSSYTGGGAAAETPETDADLDAYQEVARNTMAIHITDILPRGSLMIPGNGGSNGSHPRTGKSLMTPEMAVNISNKAPWRRFTLHWSLGGPVETHYVEKRKTDWSGKSYAILEPLGALLDTSIGGQILDWVSVGPHKLSKEAVILVPETKLSNVPANLEGHISVYDDTRMNIREAVLAYMNAHHLPVIEFDYATRPHFLITPENMEAEVRKTAALDPKQPMSKERRQLFDNIKREGIEKQLANLRYVLPHVGIIQAADKDMLAKQLITVSGEQKSVENYLKPVLDRYQNLKIQPVFEFDHVKADLLMSKLFGSLSLFLVAKELGPEDADVKQGIYNQIKAENPQQLVKLYTDLKGVLKTIENEIPESMKDVSTHWLKGIKIWVNYMIKAKRLKMLVPGQTFYSQPIADINSYINQVIATVKLHSVDPIMASYVLNQSDDHKKEVNDDGVATSATSEPSASRNMRKF